LPWFSGLSAKVFVRVTPTSASCIALGNTAKSCLYARSRAVRQNLYGQLRFDGSAAVPVGMVYASAGAFLFLETELYATLAFLLMILRAQICILESRE